MLSPRDYCRCLSGWFLDAETCRECMQGAECTGSNEITLLPGYFSSNEDRGSVFRCFSNPSQCPGGLPGACSSGREQQQCRVQRLPTRTATERARVWTMWPRRLFHSAFLCAADCCWHWISTSFLPKSSLLS